MMHNDHSQHEAALAPVAPLSVDDVRAADELTDEQHQVLGARLAGGINLAIVILGLPFLGDGGPLSNPLSLIFDAIISVMLLMGNLKIRNFAIFRMVVGTLIYGAMSVATGAFVELAIQVLLYGLLGSLLVGVPRRRRRVASASLGAIIILMMIAGLAATYTDFGLHTVEGETSPLIDGKVVGVDTAYALVAPASFVIREREAALAGNPATDTWLFDPRQDAHALTVCYDLSEVVDEEVFVVSIIDEMLAQDTKRKLISRTARDGEFMRRLARIEMSGDISMITDVNVRGDEACVVYTFVPRAQAARSRKGLISLLDSFRFTEPVVAGGTHAIANAMVKGRKAPYAYTAPAKYVARDAAFLDEKFPHIDQWVVHPVDGVSLVTVCDRAEEGRVFDVDAYFKGSVDDFVDEGDVVNVLVDDKDSGHGVAEVTSAFEVSFIDTHVHDDVGCVTTSIIPKRLVSRTRVDVLNALKTFVLE